MGKVVVEVCTGTHCVMLGSTHMMDSIASLAEIQQEMGNDCQIEVRPVACLDLCKQGITGPIVVVDGKLLPQADSAEVMAVILNRCRSASDGACDR